MIKNYDFNFINHSNRLSYFIVLYLAGKLRNGVRRRRCDEYLKSNISFTGKYTISYFLRIEAIQISCFLKLRQWKFLVYSIIRFLLIFCFDLINLIFHFYKLNNFTVTTFPKYRNAYLMLQYRFNNELLTQSIK